MAQARPLTSGQSLDKAAGMPPRSQRVYCNPCRRETNHVARGEYETKSELNDEGAFQAETHRLLSCAGCDTPSLETITEIFDPGEQSDPLASDSSFQPERTKESHHPKFFRRIPKKLRTIY